MCAIGVYRLEGSNMFSRKELSMLGLFLSGGVLIVHSPVFALIGATVVLIAVLRRTS